MQRLRTVTLLDVSAVAGHHAMPAALLLILIMTLEVIHRQALDKREYLIIFMSHQNHML